MEATYRPLDVGRREIRLLRLQPRHWQPRTVMHAVRKETSTPTVDRTFQCTLEYVSLDSGPDYAALSYTWHDPGVQISECDIADVGEDQSPRIWLDDRPMSVTPNLLMALTHLQKLDNGRKGAPKQLWVDAICINQADTTERIRTIRSQHHYKTTNRSSRRQRMC